MIWNGPFFWWFLTFALVLDKAGVVMVAFVDLYCCKQRSRVCPPQQIGICLRHKGLLPSLQRIRAKLLTSSSVLDTDAKVALTPELQLASFQIKIGWLDPLHSVLKSIKHYFFCTMRDIFWWFSTTAVEEFEIPCCNSHECIFEFFHILLRDRKLVACFFSS